MSAATRKLLLLSNQSLPIHKQDSLPTWLDEVSELADQRFPRMVQVRRYLHQNPELSDQEFATTRYLAAAIEKLDLPIQITQQGRGLTAELDTAKPELLERRIAIRGDIDALPIDDNKQVPYRSTCPGVMHACGHDAHATIILSALEILTELHHRGSLPWPISVRGIFQPSEEKATGATYMIEQGALENIDAILALHVDPFRPVGTVGIKGGILTAAADLMTISFNGKGGHGARPHLTIDPIDACTQWIQTAYRRIARTADPQRTVVFSIGKIAAGSSANVIPNTATIFGTLRSLDFESREVALKTLDDVSESIRQQTGCEISISMDFSAPAVHNDQACTDLVSHSVQSLLGSDSLQTIEQPSMGSEDFSCYLNHVPGAMFRLGIANDEIGNAALHTPGFDIDERALAIGAKLFAASVIDFFKPVGA